MGHYFEGILLETGQIADALLPIGSGKAFETKDVIDRLIAMGLTEAHAARAAKGLLLREDRSHRISLGVDGWSADAERYFGLPGRLGFLIRLENEIVDHGASIELNQMLARAFLPASKPEFPAYTTSGDPSLIKALVEQVFPHWYATPRKVDDLHWIELEGYLHALPFRNTRKGPVRSTFEYKGNPDWLTPSLPLAYAHALVVAAIQHERYDLFKNKQQFTDTDHYATANLLRARRAKQVEPAQPAIHKTEPAIAPVPEHANLVSTKNSQCAPGDMKTRLDRYLAGEAVHARARHQLEDLDLVEGIDLVDFGSVVLDEDVRMDAELREDLLLDNGRRFITFEGGEGTGKSTQAKALGRALGNLTPRKVCLSREPGGSALAEELRSAILSGRYTAMSAAAEAIMFSAARADHMATKILPALTRGDWVVCDRFFDSTRAYQGAAGYVDQKFLDMLDAGATMGRSPDLTIILDLPAEVSLARAAARRGSDAPDRFEAEDLEFHERLRQGFLAIAEKDSIRCCVINCEGLDPLQVNQQVIDVVSSRLLGPMTGGVYS